MFHIINKRFMPDYFFVVAKYDKKGRDKNRRVDQGLGISLYLKANSYEY